MKDQLKDEDLHRVGEGEAINKSIKRSSKSPRPPRRHPSSQPSTSSLRIGHPGHQKISKEYILLQNYVLLFRKYKFICTGVLLNLKE